MRKRWGVLVALMLVAAITFLIGGPPLIRFLTDQARVQAWIAGFGAWGPLALIGLIVVQIVLSVSPVSLLAAASAYVFGFWGGVIYSGLGMAIGSALNMTLGRRFGRPLVDRLIDPAYLDTFDRFNQERGAIFYFIVFVMPWVPDDLACYAIGLSRLSLKLMIPIAAVGRLPSVIVQCWLVANANQLSTSVIVAVVAAGMVMGLLFYRYHRRLESFVLNLAARFSRHSVDRGEV
jgi:uncharacterized membrane protein YdjX (TVP38/TMEM64 family)